MMSHMSNNSIYHMDIINFVYKYFWYKWYHICVINSIHHHMNDITNNRIYHMSIIMLEL